MSLTKHLYQFDEVVSSLQKSIRRGLPNQAIFWAGEIYNTNDEHAFFLFKKLFTILVEDIGLASPELILFTWPLFLTWNDSIDRIQVDTIFIKFIKLLTSTKKNRLIANLLVYLTKFDYPPDKDKIVNLDFDEFKMQYENTAEYILEMISNEKKIWVTDSLDLFSALVQFVHALGSREYNNAYFFAHILNQINVEGSSPHHVIGRLCGKMSDTNINKASIYIWGIITNKILLKEIGVRQIDKLSSKIIKRLYLLTVYGLGNSNYNLLFAIALISKPINISIGETTNIIESNYMNVTTLDLNIFINNNPGSIFQRRQFKIPEYALDLNTRRGRGINPKKNNRSTEYYLFNTDYNCPTDCIVPPIIEWPPEEIEKSHGNYKVYSTDYTHIQFMQYEGNYLVNYDESIDDVYSEQAYRFLLDIEASNNYTHTKYTKLTKFLIDDAIKNQIYWLVFPNFSIQNNPLPFNGTWVSETHLYEHDIFYDIVKIPGTSNDLFSAKLCYPEGYCPIPVIVYGPIINSNILEHFKDICQLKKILDPENINLKQPEYHILNVYPTTKGIEKEYPFLIMKQEGTPLLNIISYSFEHTIVKRYILLLIFHMIPTHKKNGNNYAIFCKNNAIYGYDPEFVDITLNDLTDEGYISSFIKMYRTEFLAELKLWQQRIMNQCDCSNSQRIEELHSIISNL